MSHGDPSVDVEGWFGSGSLCGSDETPAELPLHPSEREELETLRALVSGAYETMMRDRGAGGLHESAVAYIQAHQHAYHLRYARWDTLEPADNPEFIDALRKLESAEEAFELRLECSGIAPGVGTLLDTATSVANMLAPFRIAACSRCETVIGVRMESSRRVDDRLDIPLCGWCAEEHHAHWDEMWDDYNQGRI